MTGRDAFEAMGDISDKLIMEAGDKLGMLGVGAAKTKTKGQSVFSRFINSGWGVAAVCALVAIGVMGGIIWAGNQPGTYQPAGSPTETDTDNGDDTWVRETEDGTVPTEGTEAPTLPENAAFDFSAALTAIDQLASENCSIRLKYHVTPYGGLPQEYSGSVGQAGGKYWSYANLDGSAVLEEEGGYYHLYAYENSKFWYQDTYTMTENNAFDQVYNGRYWWKNYLEALTFDAYDELIYAGNGQVAEEACRIFSFNGTVKDGSRVELALYVDVSRHNVMKLEVEILENGDGSHLSTDAREAVIEVERISTGDDAKGPTLPDPKWDGPQDDPIEIETLPETLPPEDPDTGGNTDPPSIPDDEDLIQAPLVSADDSTSYVRLPYLSRGEDGVLEFFVLPEDIPDAEPVSVKNMAFKADSETNLLVVGVEKSPTTYSVLLFMETGSVEETNGEEVRYVSMMCTEFSFFRDKTLSKDGTLYFHSQNGGSMNVSYTDRQRDSVLAAKRHDSLNALKHAEDLLADYSGATDYKYTVIYSYSSQSAEEMVLAHISELPAFNFEIFREYGLSDRDK